MSFAEKKILICDRFSTEAFAYLKKSPNFEILLAKSAEHFHEHLPTANALVIRSKQKITKEILDQAKHLEVIVTCTSGYDHIDLDETKKRA